MAGDPVSMQTKRNTLMNTQVWVQNPQTGHAHYEYITIPDDAIRRAVPQPQPVQLPTPRAHNGHPLLIAGLVIGLFVGLIACLPASVRGWVVLAILALGAWGCWTLSHPADNFVFPEAPVETAGTAHPVYSDYAPRAELVKLPSK
jgi:hypothetical protein